MSRVVYKIVQHGEGWAYRVAETFSETFPSYDLARKAARDAAAEHQQSGSTVGISFEDAAGHWHEELSDGSDRPQATVEEKT